jgi:hypothetical protein
VVYPLRVRGNVAQKCDPEGGAIGVCSAQFADMPARGEADDGRQIGRPFSRKPPADKEIETTMNSNLVLQQIPDSTSAPGTVAPESSGAEKAAPEAKPTLRSLRAAAEVLAIRQALQESGWNRKRAAQLLSISYRGLLYKLRQHGIMP